MKVFITWKTLTLDRGSEVLQLQSRASTHAQVQREWTHQSFDNCRVVQFKMVPTCSRKLHPISQFSNIVRLVEVLRPTVIDYFLAFWRGGGTYPHPQKTTKQKNKNDKDRYSKQESSDPSISKEQFQGFRGQNFTLVFQMIYLPCITVQTPTLSAKSFSEICTWSCVLP